MELDYPIYDLVNPEYEYIPWISSGTIEEIPNEPMMDQ